MHIGLNLIFLVPGETGGMEVYAREPIPELVKAAPEHRFTAFINREAAADDAPWGNGVSSVVVPVRARHRAEWVRGEQQLLPVAATRAGVELLHSLGSTAPGWGRFQRVVTIHDLNYRTVERAHLGLRGLGMRILVPLAARRSDRIIADSQTTANDVVSFVNVPRERVDVVPLGIGSLARSAPLPEAVIRSALQLGARRMVLTVSAKRPHKNLGRLLDALALIPSERRPTLVLPGYPTPYEHELRDRAAQLGLDGDVRFLGWVEASFLEGLYAAASCFVFPSLYEGFGLPVLEAMSRGVPVACSNRGSLAEVAGDAALLFDPTSAPAIASAIERLLEDASLGARLRSAGLAQAGRFSWGATAAATLASYRRALGSEDVAEDR